MKMTDNGKIFVAIAFVSALSFIIMFKLSEKLK